MRKKGDYGVRTVVGIEYVTVRCPQGHCLQGMKVIDMEVAQELACPECRVQWTILAPLTNGLEVCSS